MKFRVERDVLAEAVAWVARGLPQRPPAPVLGGVLIEADGEGTVTFSAFDYEVSARLQAPAEVTEPGTVLVHGRLLNDICRNLPAKPVTIELLGAKVELTCGSSRFSLVQMPSEEYPTLPASPEPTGSVDGTLFTEAVGQVAIAADRGDTLPILTGVRVEIEGERMTLLATDRYRLAMRELQWTPGSSDANHIMLIPARTLTDIARAIGASGSVQLAVAGDAGGDGLVGFEAGSRRATTRLLDGEYPKVSSIFPASSDIHAVVSTAELSEAVKRVSLVAERNTPVRLAFTDGQVSIEAGAGDNAQASEAVVATLEGGDIEVAFNPGYLLDGLGAVGTAYSRLSFTQPTRPVVLAGQTELEGEADTAYRYVIMPIRFASSA